MERQRKHWLSAQQKTDIWKMWRQGESLSEIGRALGRHPSGPFRVISKGGGISPVTRTRSGRALTLAEREDISRSLAAGISMRQIAVQLGRPTSTVTREVARNGGSQRYRAHEADASTWERALRPKACALSNNARLRRLVAARLKLQWAPVQIAGWLRREFPGNKDMQISHETIYRSLFIQTRGVLKKELVAHLRTNRTMRQAKSASERGQGRGRICGAVSISERPAEADDRAVPGHWEGDLLAGADNTYIATLVERHSRYVMLVKVAGKDAQSVASALIRQVNKLPAQLRRSLTWDRGTEMASHRAFTVATQVQVYFCDPQSPWQRGSNENTNGLLRQYFPKGTRLDGYTQAELNKVAARLNGRPRLTLQFMNPAEKLAETLALH
ncbi:IS30 family transposase [Paraburkholderia sp.]|uniref:IS30 family transposase n=1 Tax=Paraburkholderia sp. TaxID=1926495 RepID=UPI00238CCCD3|nr:IS30 family transposase [Paraburkholderia sp.]MDE1180178.1 IS30 family transposase [Paraburkholderia sp.]